MPEVYTRVARSEPEIFTGLASNPVRFCLPFSVTSVYDRTGQAKASLSFWLGSPHRTATNRRNSLNGFCKPTKVCQSNVVKLKLCKRVAKSGPEILTGLASKPVGICLPFSVTSVYDSTGQAQAYLSFWLDSHHSTATKHKILPERLLHTRKHTLSRRQYRSHIAHTLNQWLLHAMQRS